MNTSLKHLDEAQIKKLERVIPIIVRAIQPEKIILYGLYGAAGYGSVAADTLPPVLGAYDLLVVSRQGDRRSDYELQDIIENRCREEAPVTALVHDIGYVNRRLSEGQHFFTTVIREGVLLYDSHRAFLTEAAVTDWHQVKWLAERDFQRWRQQARAFYRSAVFNCQHADWRVAVFLLHQATEHIYQAILLAFTGYKPTTHNLDKLRRYTNRFSVELAMVFPRDGGKDDDLFRLLLSGYVDARYKEEFSVTPEQVLELAERTGRLVDIAERVCLNQLLSLERKAAGH